VALVRVGGSEQRRLVEHATGQLQANRQIGGREATRHADRRKARQIGADGEHVREIHLQRIGHALAQLERRNRARRHRHDVDMFEGAFVILSNQRTHLLRFQIVGIVVARTQDIRAEHDAPFDLRAKPLRARLSVHRPQVIVHRLA
jgi:hypothetical protein